MQGIARRQHGCRADVLGSVHQSWSWFRKPYCVKRPLKGLANGSVHFHQTLCRQRGRSGAPRSHTTRDLNNRVSTLQHAFSPQIGLLRLNHFEDPERGCEDIEILISNGFQHPVSALISAINHIKEYSGVKIDCRSNGRVSVHDRLLTGGGGFGGVFRLLIGGLRNLGLGVVVRWAIESFGFFRVSGMALSSPSSDIWFPSHGVKSCGSLSQISLRSTLSIFASSTIATLPMPSRISIL